MHLNVRLEESEKTTHSSTLRTPISLSMSPCLSLPQPPKATCVKSTCNILLTATLCPYGARHDTAYTETTNGLHLESLSAIKPSGVPDSHSERRVVLFSSMAPQIRGLVPQLQGQTGG